ncbi:MAG: hypothetical protein KME14_20370 [Tildeniella torsiva UHER 1998/13D]|jgi:hypothetical protein|nr:hypothetical protein [Tildeniella torsiva UHER 1998/13D]
MTPAELHSHLSTNPGKSYTTLNAEARALLRTHLRPGPGGFTQQQREWLQGFYLVLPDQATHDAIAAVLSPGLCLSTLETLDKTLVLNADLLTDCLQPEDNWSAIAPHLATLEIRYVPAEDFPEAEAEI